jgi:hypothetical protein
LQAKKSTRGEFFLDFKKLREDQGETGLLAGGGVLGVEYARAAEQVESRFHGAFV